MAPMDSPVESAEISESGERSVGTWLVAQNLHAVVPEEEV